MSERVTGRSGALRVFITVDTEFWLRAGPTPAAVKADVRRDVYGETPRGEYGIRFQIERLNAHGLKAVYFVEALSASAVGGEPLEAIVDTVVKGGQEVQLHVHTEWLPQMAAPLLAGRRGQNIRDFSQEEQRQLLAKALDNLAACGVSARAFRAGNYGADDNTLRALAELGLVFDTSHNACYLDSTCHITSAEPVLQPRWLHGVFELPIAVFRDRPRHQRPAQITACSSAEMRHALLEAWRAGWSTFVIVTHSFELLNRRRTGPDPIMVRRFEDLCAFLADHRDKFQTATFADLAPRDVPPVADARPLRSNTLRTGWRYVEQGVRYALA